MFIFTKHHAYGFLTLILCLTLLALPVNADMDLQELSTDELLQLRNNIDDMLYLKGGLVVIQNGQYYCDRDLPAGSYTITGYSDITDYDSPAWHLEITDENGTQILGNNSYLGDHFRFSIEVGQTLRLENYNSKKCIPILVIEKNNPLFSE